MWSVLPLPLVGLGTELRIRAENWAQSSDDWIIELSVPRRDVNALKMVAVLVRVPGFPKEVIRDG